MLYCTWIITEYKFKVGGHPILLKKNVYPDCSIGIGDLHLHTSASDGLYSAQEIINMGKAKGLSYISITDHDTINGLISISGYSSKDNLKIIPGIELSTEYYGHEVHILGYSLDPQNSKLNKFMLFLSESRQNRIQNIVQKLQTLGYKINMDSVLKHASGSSSLGRPHVALALIEKGYFSNIDAAFKALLDRGAPGYVPRVHLRPHEAIQLIIDAGGIPILAHPGTFFSAALFKYLLKSGLRGIEVFYPEHDLDEEAYFYQLASNNDLIITGGSDFHGYDHEDHMNFGNIFIPNSTFRQLITD